MILCVIEPSLQIQRIRAQHDVLCHDTWRCVSDCLSSGRLAEGPGEILTVRVQALGEDEGYLMFVQSWDNQVLPL
jgi:hypothetical protein